MNDAVIVAAARTPVGSFQGSLANLPAADLGAIAARAVLERAGLPADAVDEVVLGHVLAAGAGQNTARQAAVKAGIPFAVPSLTLNKVCGSGLRAVQLAAQTIRLGDASIVLAGGMESMSLAPYVVPGLRTGQSLGHGRTLDTLVQD